MEQGIKSANNWMEIKMTMSNPYAIVLEAMKSTPVNLDSILRQLGIELSKVELDDDISGMIERKNGNNYLITVNSKHHPNRQRFTIAHELSHYLLHRDKLEGGTLDTKKYRTCASSKLYNQNINRQEEKEANNLAASILMPEELVVEFYKHFENLRVNSYSFLASIFGVSQSAMEIRINELSAKGLL